MIRSCALHYIAIVWSEHVIVLLFSCIAAHMLHNLERSKLHFQIMHEIGHHTKDYERTIVACHRSFLALLDGVHANRAWLIMFAVN